MYIRVAPPAGDKGRPFNELTKGLIVEVILELGRAQVNMIVPIYFEFFVSRLEVFIKFYKDYLLRSATIFHSQPAREGPAIAIFANILHIILLLDHVFA